MSIDPKDVQPAWMQEDLTLNEIESIIELVSEDILGFSDAIPEHEEADGDTNNHSFSHVYIRSSILEFTKKIHFNSNLYYRVVNVSIYSSTQRDIIPPPPKAYFLT